MLGGSARQHNGFEIPSRIHRQTNKMSGYKEFRDIG